MIYLKGRTKYIFQSLWIHFTVIVHISKDILSTQSATLTCVPIYWATFCDWCFGTWFIQHQPIRHQLLNTFGSPCDFLPLVSCNDKRKSYIPWRLITCSSNKSIELFPCEDYLICLVSIKIWFDIYFISSISVSFMYIFS